MKEANAFLRANLHAIRERGSAELSHEEYALLMTHAFIDAYEDRQPTLFGYPVRLRVG